jgi:hypothetical protein
MTSPERAVQLSTAARKANRERDASRAMREYQAERARVDANTVRMRALRLSKAATDATVDQAAAAVKRPLSRVAKSERDACSRSSS